MTMKPVVPIFCVVQVLAAGQAAAETKPADVTLWLSGCIDLVQQESAAANQMDVQCVANAVDFCMIGRTREEHAACFEAISAALNTRTETLLSAKPDSSLLTGFAPRTFDSYWSTAERKDHSDTCPQHMQERAICEVLTSMARWTAARSAIRIWRRNQE